MTKPSIEAEKYEADTSPRPDGNKDATVTIADWVQVGRYAAGLDNVIAAGGPTSPAVALANVSSTDFSRTVFTNSSISKRGTLNLQPVATRTIRAVNASFSRGQIGSLQIELAAQGNENAAAFSLNYDPKAMTFLDAAVGEGANGAAVQVNQSQAINGRIGFALALPAGQQLAAGTRALLNLRFIPNGGDGETVTNVSFSDQLLPREVADVNAGVVAGVSYADAAITITGKAVATVSAANYVGGSRLRNLLSRSLARNWRCSHRRQPVCHCRFRSAAHR